MKGDKQFILTDHAIIQSRNKNNLIGRSRFVTVFLRETKVQTLNGRG